MSVHLELFVKAGNQYKVANMHDKAAAMFLKASDSFKLGDGCDLQAINNLVEAATCFRKAKNNDGMCVCLNVGGTYIVYMHT